MQVGGRAFTLSRGFVLQFRRAGDVLIHQDRVSVRIDKYQWGRAGGGFISLQFDPPPQG
jgi:hypothetical protein